MKKLLCVLWMLLMLGSLAACGSEKNTESGDLMDASASDPAASQAQSEEETPPEASSEPTQGSGLVDVDLTKLSSTMVYSEVYHLIYNPDDYIGKTIKMEGQFAYYENPDTKDQYFACIIADAMACCSQGLDFVLAGEHTYPDDYPAPDTEITVTGTLEMYEVDGFQYCRLVDAAIVNETISRS